MAQNNRPVFANIINNGYATVSVANTSGSTVTNPVDSTNFRELIVAPAGGTYVSRINYLVTATSGTPASAAARFNLWITDTSGLNARILQSIQLPVVAAINNTIPGAGNTAFYEQLVLQEGQKLYASVTVLTANTELNVIVFGGNLIS